VATNLVTGATGLVGFNIVEALRVRGQSVRVLVRDPARARELLPGGSVEIVRGDVTDSASVRSAMEGCDVVYHSAGLPEQWLSDPGRFAVVNVGGTRNIVDAAISLGVERLVYTSTIDVFDAAHGQDYDESVLAGAPKGTPYERSKQDAERVVLEALQRGLDAVLLHPSAVYGPGPRVSKTLNDLLEGLYRGTVPVLLPGGMPVVYAADVGEGHVLARERAAAGDRFILSESYWSLDAMAAAVTKRSRFAKVPMVAPLPAVKVLALLGGLVSRLTRTPPLVTSEQIHFLSWGAKPDAGRAKRELGWQPTAFLAGLDATFAALDEG